MGSGDFRRKLAADQARVARGISTQEFDPAAFISLMRVIREKLRISVDRASITPLMHFLYGNFEQSAVNLSQDKLACRKGCSHCCNIWTDAYAPEVFFVAKKLSKESNPSVSQSVADTGAFSSNVSFGQRDRVPIPCPLLVDDVCSMYEARPFNCRTAVSLDDEVCKRAFIDGQDVEIPVAPGWGNLGQLYSMALKGAIYHANLAFEPYEWNSALQRAIKNPDLEKRWLSGEDVFAGMPVATPAEPFSHPFWRGLFDRAFTS